MRIRIATWNIAGARKMLSTAKFDYDVAEDLQYFANQLNELNLDIVCLQESHINSQDSLAKRIASELGMQHVAETAGCPSHIDERYRQTTAVLSKIPFTKTANWILPQPNFELTFAHNNRVVPPYDRYIQLLEFGNFSVATMHPEPLGAFGLAYEEGVGEELGKSIDAFLQNKLERPIVFAADFNMEDPLGVLSMCTRDFELQEVLANVVTTPLGKHPDHILHSPKWHVVDAGVSSTKSDHYLCWAELELRN